MISDEDMVGGTSHPGESHPGETTVPEKMEEDPPQETTTDGTGEIEKKTSNNEFSQLQGTE
jgi:hypothetical protein